MKFPDVYKNLRMSRGGVRSGKGLDTAGSVSSSAAGMCWLTSWLRWALPPCAEEDIPDANHLRVSQTNQTVPRASAKVEERKPKQIS